MKTTGAKIVSKLSWAIGKTLNLVGAIGFRVIRDISNRPKHNIQVINTNTGEVMHEARNVSTAELNKILDAMRTLRGTVQTIVKTVK